MKNSKRIRNFLTNGNVYLYFFNSSVYPAIKSFDSESAVYLCSDQALMSMGLMSMGLMFFFFWDYFIGWWEPAANPKWIILTHTHTHFYTHKHSSHLFDKCLYILRVERIKRIVHSLQKILSSFSHPHVFSSSYDLFFFCGTEKEMLGRI